MTPAQDIAIAGGGKEWLAATAACSEQMQRIERMVIVFAVILLSAPSLAEAALGRFTPQLYSTEGWLLADAQYQSQDHSSDVSSSGWSNTYIAERFVLTSTGWVYHPRFMIFLTSLGAGLAHESVTNDFRDDEPSGMQSTFLGEYEFRTVLLPEHDYNLELYTLRNNPYLQGTVSLGYDTVGYESGAIFKYKRRPWALNVSYVISSTDADRYTTDSDAFRANAVYFQEWGTLAGSYSHEDFDSTYRSVSTQTTRDEYSAENQLRFFDNKVYLTSNVNKLEFFQDSTAEDMDNERFTWNEKLNIELPLNFNVNLYYNQFDETTTSDTPGFAGKTTLDNDSDIAGVSVIHKLYQSLVTSYNFTNQSNKSTTGDTDGTVNSLTMAYNKSIPRGLLLAGLYYSVSDVDRTGVQTILNERAQAPLFGEFTLQLVDIDEATISMQVLSPFTGSFVSLARGVNYIVTTIGNTIRIQIISLPPSVLSPDPFYVYTFQATYSLLEENARIETTTYGGSLRLELFNNAVSPFFAYTRSEQTTDSSVGPAPTPLDTTTYIAGILLQKDPYSLLLEYQDYQSNVNPYTLMRAELQYRKNITSTTRLTAEGIFQRTSRGESDSQGSDIDEDYYGVSVWLQKRYPKKNMILSLGSQYNRATGVNTRQSYSVSGELFWKLKKFELRAGIGVGGTKVDYDTGSQDSLYQSYTLSVRRQIF